MSGPEDLVATALLGTGRRRADLTGWPDPLARAASALAGDPAAVLLQQAALATVWLRAGALPGPAPVVVPAPEEVRPVVPARAAARLDAILAASDDALLAEWLTAAAAAGFVVPAAALPGLLDRAARTTALRDVVRAAGGSRAGWLAVRRDAWRWWGSGGLAADPAAAPTCGEDDRDDEVWRFGTPDQRRRRLAAARRADPGRARDALAAVWSKEPGPTRAALLGELAHGLSRADEALLEQALDDRRKDVRQTAARLLAALPGSALSQRMVLRVQAIVRHERSLLRRRLVVRPPDEPDAAAVRDGVVDPAPTSRAEAATGRRATWVQQVVAACPLSVWSEVGPPQDVVRLAVDDGWAPVLRAGWAAAAAREGDVAWVEALLSVDVDVTGGLGSERLATMLAGLPPAERARLAVLVLDGITGRVRRREAPTDAAAAVAAVLAGCERPWPAPLVGAVLAWLGATSERLPSWPYHGVVDLLAHALPPAAAPRLVALAGLAGRGRDDDDAQRWTARLQGAATVLTTRAEMLEELR